MNYNPPRHVAEHVAAYKPRVHVYVAGPYSNPDPVENTHRAVLAGERLYAEGFFPVVPHITMVQHLIVPHEPAHWYERDLHALSRCDALLRLPGFSTGADDEVQFAQRHGIPVYFSIEQLIANPPEA